MKKIRVFVDTSVFGGCFDDEFKKESVAFFDLVKRGHFQIVISNAIVDELDSAPDHIGEYVRSLPAGSVEFFNSDEEVFKLRDSYIDQQVVTMKSLNDAEHIAAATIAGVDLIVSWNFKHIVHFQKIKGFNGVNLIKGYQVVDIRSPSEVIDYEE
jgi:predicted nucleic acid-binding protein